MGKEKINFDQLDLFRFIAAFMVILAHAYEGWSGYFGVPGFMSNNDYKTLNVMGKYLNTAIFNFSFGVDIFFMISGFLITYILLAEKEETGTISLKNFYVRRVLRIWPLYYFLILVTPFLIRWLGEAEPDYLSTILFYNNFHAIQTEKWVYPFAHFWSICIEEHFYLFWPILILVTPKKYLMTFFCSIIFLSILFRIYIGIFVPTPFFSLYLHTFCRMDVLAIGAIGAYLRFNGKLTVFPDRKFRWMLYFLFIIMIFNESIVNWNTLFLVCFKKYFYCGVAALAMLNYQFNPEANRIFKGRNILFYLGKTSYGMYMYGNIVLLIVIKQIMWRFQIQNMYYFFIIVTLVSLVVPVLSYEIFEKQFLKLKSRFQIIKTVDS